jgi:predicted ATPase
MISNIHIQNFKSIKDASINLTSLNVLVGMNGAGKSTLLEALNFTKKAIIGTTIDDVARINAPFSIDFFNYYSEGYVANFSFDVFTSSNKKFNYSFSVGFNPDFNSKQNFYINSEKLIRIEDSSSKVIFDRNPSSNVISFNIGDVPNPLPIGIENNRLFLGTISQVDAREIVDTIGSYAIIWADQRYDANGTNEMLVDDPSSTLTVDDVAVALKLKDENRFNDAVETIQKIIPEFKAPDVINLSEVTNRAAQSKVDKEPAKKSSDYRYIVNWMDSRHEGTTFTRFAISGGNLRVIYLILSLYNTESRSCFVAEEIENGMHPGRVKRLVQVLISIAKQRKLQLIFSTHSYLLTSELLPRDVILCSYVDGSGSTYTRLSESEQFALVKETLNTEPSTEDLLGSGLFD